VFSVSTLINHALTHIFEFLFGVNHDEDHLAHAFWNLATAMHMEETRPDMLADLPPYSERMIEYKPVAPESAEWDRQQAAKKEASSVTVTSPSPEPAPSPSWPPFTEKFGKTPPIFDTASLRKKLRNFLANADDKYSNETAPEDSVEFDGDFSKLPMPMTIGEYQEQINAWSKKNFPDNWSESGKHRPLLGMGEEAGEIGEALMDMMLQLGVKVGRLNHAFLKTQQGIRGSAEEHLNKIIDGVADLFIFMCNFCGVINVNLEQSIYDTWEEVRKRDWTKNKNTGK
jgi:NTP pyrophosphatase (non-canonical NTP hydrolase)